jgi:hypothetical protein
VAAMTAYETLADKASMLSKGKTHRAPSTAAPKSRGVRFTAVSFAIGLTPRSYPRTYPVIGNLPEWTKIGNLPIGS